MMVSNDHELIGSSRSLQYTDAVSSTVLHPMGTIAATTSGQRRSSRDINAVDETIHPTKKVDNSLKVWSMPFLDTAVS
jgi:hypothetical protein